MALAGLVTATAILTSRVSSFRRDEAAAERRVASLEASVREVQARALAAESGLDEAEQTGRKLRREVRQSQSCEQPPFDHGPHVWLFPTQGPPGTQVRIVGGCFLGSFWRHWRSGYGMFLLRQFIEPRECELIAGVLDPVLRIRRGWAEGAFTVPAGRGSCFQHLYERRITPAIYSLGLGCHACNIARFRVTAT